MVASDCEGIRISVVTATFNVVKELPGLIESLRSQVYKNFEWVVADGGSTDGTLELLSSIENLDIRISSEEDFGIYDALNRGIRKTSGQYYLVLGADDRIYPNALSEYAKNAYGVDFVTAAVRFGERLSFPLKVRGWQYGYHTYVSAHSVGLLISKNLHEQYGYYSRKFPIVADQYFVLSAIKGGANIVETDVEVGVHGVDGVSGTDRVGVITELYRVQVLIGESLFLQTILCSVRLLKYALFDRFR
ncbi:glycosyltransferase [Pseudomonas sp. MAFF 302030]|uniref:Glycosyltransferase n=1 Tax=Pseudomonas morbosilactucae TaxID=2938197 RepID=A0A9X1Z0H4_9PSED|nr:glycosyltransferase [Pseudomonas morbosilactucae]MCK9801673.1 glycosyltransferase [Pseudomonas morbosilactucae]